MARDVEEMDEYDNSKYYYLGCSRFGRQSELGVIFDGIPKWVLFLMAFRNGCYF